MGWKDNPGWRTRHVSAEGWMREVGALSRVPRKGKPRSMWKVQTDIRQRGSKVVKTMLSVNINTTLTNFNLEVEKPFFALVTLKQLNNFLSDVVYV